MKNHKMTHIVLHSSIYLLFILALWSPVQSQSAEPVEGKSRMVFCQEMQEQQQKMMAEMKKQDFHLTTQLATMNNAPDDKKLGMLAVIVTHLVEQRVAMNAEMIKIQEMMTKHYSQQRRLDETVLLQYPIMNRMNGMNERSGDSPTEQK